MRQSTQTIAAVLAVIVLAAAFWLLFLGPKREKANELGEQTKALTSEVATSRSQLAEGETAKANFPELYRQLIVLGKAVPAEAATPSLLVQLNGVSARASTKFKSISLGGEGAGEAAPTAESAASQLPIGATVGAAGLPVMSYTLSFEGGFFDVADFIQGLDALVQTKGGEVDAEGRLVTIDSFILAPQEEGRSSELNANFQVTTYLTPPSEGLTAGATAAGPSSETETP